MINVPQTQNSSQATAYLLNGSNDYSWTGVPQNILNAFLSKSSNHLQPAWDWSEFDWYFNNKSYPLNNVKVRQALAYAIDRRATSIIGDGPNGVLPVSTITGLQYAVQKQWIPASVLKSLNPYRHDTSKAAALLKSAGFKLQGNQWIMPNGKPFTLNIISPAGWTDIQLDAEAVANELTKFGIHTTASTVEQPGYWTQQNKGQYQISFGWGGWWAFNPIQTYYDSLVNQNYTPGQPGYIGMGFGPTVNVPGLGKVNITQNLTEALRIESKAKIQQLAIDYAKLVNQQLPFLPFADKRIEVEYSDARYTHWPAKTSYLWNQVGGDAQGALLLMMLNGYVIPKQ
ncbi:MAG: hypothetical protein K6T83_08910 [Alicyclobacillus sp.]|nr:hypothetical protein [Alicyclobacillus sp.]